MFRKFGLNHKAKLMALIIATFMVVSSFAFFTNMPSSSAVGKISVKPSADASSIYLVQFVETGLPLSSQNGVYGFLWGVNISGEMHESSTNTIGFYMHPASNVSYVIKAVSNFSATPSSGTFNVTSSNVLIDITYSSTTYGITFSEEGLPSTGSSTEWSVNFNGMTVYSNSTMISLTEPDGTYAYTIHSESVFLPDPSSGTITIDGSSVSIPVQFTNNFEIVTFFEHGLPRYSSLTQTQWRVTLKNTSLGLNVSETSFNTSLNFNVPSGNYTYSASTINTFNLSGGSGTVTVIKKFTYVNITFIPDFNGVEFLEHGLPYSVNGTSSATPLWSVNLKNNTKGVNFTDYSNQPQLFFNVTNGNYRFVVSMIQGFSILPGSGYVNVSNGFYIINIFYTSDNTYLAFKEKGLFSNTTSPSSSFGDYWSVTVINSTGHHFVQGTDGNLIKFWLPYGDYTYYTSNNTGFLVVNETGTITLNAPETEHIGYNLSSGITLTKGSGRLAAIDLYEYGLAPGTTWDVALSTNNVNATSQITDSALIIFYVPNGTYYIRILDSSGFHPNPSSFYLTVDTSTSQSYNYSIRFASAFGYVNFTEVGLVHGTVWSVAINDSANNSFLYSTSFNNLSIALPNGTYFYRVLEPSTNLDPFTNSSGYIYISTTKPLSFISRFISNEYPVSFSERGLPQGFSWNLLLTYPNGNIVQYSLNTGLISIELTNGTYRYSAVSTDGYLDSPSFSLFTVNGPQSSSIQHNVTFKSDLYSVTFAEAGLPSGAMWSATIDGIYSQTTLGALSFSLPGGTYIYHLSSAGSYVPINAVGVISVSKSNVSVSVIFEKFDYSVTFQEKNLPVNTEWSVSIDNQVFTSNGTGISVVLSNGTYSYRMIQQGYYIPVNSNGQITVSGENITMSIAFVSTIYELSFKQTGALPSGTPFTVLLENITGVQASYSTTTSYNNVSLVNGTYSFTLLESDFYVAIPSTGTVSIDGSNVSIDVAYEIFKYTVTFTENGLPSGNTWNVTLLSSLGQTFSLNTTTSSLSFDLVNGTYSFQIISDNKTFSPNPISGSIVVNGEPQNIAVQFSKVLYDLDFSEKGLPKNTTWQVSINNVTYSSNKSSSINITLTNGTYSYEVLNVTGYTVSPQIGKIVVNGANLTTSTTFALKVTVIHSHPPPVTPKYNTFIVIGTLVGIGVIGLAVITVIYYQRKRI